VRSIEKKRRSKGFYESRRYFRDYDADMRYFLASAKAFIEDVRIGKEAYAIGNYTLEAKRSIINRNKVIIDALKEFNKMMDDADESE